MNKKYFLALKGCKITKKDFKILNINYKENKDKSFNIYSDTDGNANVKYKNKYHIISSTLKNLHNKSKKTTMKGGAATQGYFDWLMGKKNNDVVSGVDNDIEQTGKVREILFNTSFSNSQLSYNELSNILNELIIDNDDIKSKVLDFIRELFKNEKTKEQIFNLINKQLNLRNNISQDIAQSSNNEVVQSSVNLLPQQIPNTSQQPQQPQQPEQPQPQPQEQEQPQQPEQRQQPQQPEQRQQPQQPQQPQQSLAEQQQNINGGGYKKRKRKNKK